MATGDEIRKRRIELGFSQARVADAIGVKAPTVGKIERGESRHSRHKRALERHLGLVHDDDGQVKGHAEPTLASVLLRLAAVEAKLDDVLTILKRKG